MSPFVFGALVLGALSESLPHLTGSDVFMRVMAVLSLIAINAFFVTAEFSIVSVRRSRINQLASAGDVQAKTVQNLQRGIERLLSTTQLGITLSSLALGWIGESTMAVLVEVLLLKLPLPIPARPALAHSLAVPSAFLLIAYLQIVLGELCPKSVALIYSEEIARFLGAPSMAIARFFNPFIWVLNQSTRLLLRLVGVQYTGQGWYNRVTPEELQLIISTSTESPGLEEEERELLTNVFEFAEVSAREAMIPRTSLMAMSSDASLQDLLNEVATSGHSRYPVMGESLDEILGIIHFKELAEPLVRGTLILDNPILPWLRPAQFAPENTPLKDLLQMMQRSGQEMVIVIDEFGGTAGLITLQDLIAQIIGETYEPESEEEDEVQILDDRTFLVQAQINLEEVNESLELNLPLSEEYQTLGGFIIYYLQKIPRVGEQLSYGQYAMTVESVEGPRLQRIHIYRRPLTEETAEGSAEGTNLLEPGSDSSNPPAAQWTTALEDESGDRPPNALPLPQPTDVPLDPSTDAPVERLSRRPPSHS